MVSEQRKPAGSNVVDEQSTFADRKLKARLFGVWPAEVNREFLTLLDTQCRRRSGMKEWQLFR
jgi:hypothetical protein